MAGETCQPQSVQGSSQTSLQAYVVFLYLSACRIVNKSTIKFRLLFTTRRKSLSLTVWNTNLKKCFILIHWYKYLIFQSGPHLISTYSLTRMRWRVQEKFHSASKSPLWSSAPFVIHLSVTDANEEYVRYVCVCMCVCVCVWLSSSCHREAVAFFT